MIVMSLSSSQQNGEQPARGGGRSSEGSARPEEARRRRVALTLLVVYGAFAWAVALGCCVAVGWAGRGLDIDPRRVVETYWTMWFHVVAAVGCAAYGMGLRRQRRCGAVVPRAVIVSVIALSVVSVDRLVGIAVPPPSERDQLFEPHPTRGWSHRRGVVGSDSSILTRINSLGLRGPEIPVEKPRDAFRVLFLGDSITFGFGLEDSETFAVQTGALLRARSSTKRVTAINAGVGAYTTWQELDYLRREGMKLDPDVVVLGFCLNDMVDLIGTEPGMVSGRPMNFAFSNVPHWSGLVRAVLSLRESRRTHAVLDSVVWARVDPFRDENSPLRGLEDVYRDPLPAVVEKAWARSLADLDGVRRLCQSHGVAWVLMYLPMARQLVVGGEEIQPEQHLSAWSDRHGVFFLDLTPAFRAEVRRRGGDAGTLLFDEVHPKADGSTLIAEQIVTFMADKGLLPRRAE